MRIGTRIIGPDQPPYIIAELGVNHDGSVERALDLTRAAAQAGADAVKLQLFETDRLMSKAAKLAAYQKAAGETDPVAMLRRLELSIDDMARVVDFAHEHAIDAIVTVFSVDLVAKAETLLWDAYKTASPDIVHRPLLETLAATGKPLIVSTGASEMQEIGHAVGWLEQAVASNRLALMQCVSSYPTPLDQGEFDGIRAIREQFGLPTGYSDHMPTEGSSGVAVSFGAELLEKHLTYDRSAYGPDHAASLTPDQFKMYSGVAFSARDVRQQPFFRPRPPGPGKRVLPIEQDVRTVSRQSITTLRPLPRGHTLRREDLTFKRPGTGLLPFRLDEVLGRQLARDVDGDVPMTEEDLR